MYDGLTGINVFSLSPEQMRVPEKPDPGDLLLRDGANVASGVEQMRRSFPDELELVQDYLREIVPGVESVERKEIGAWESIELKQRVAGAAAPWTFPASSMSDGTLRATRLPPVCSCRPSWTPASDARCSSPVTAPTCWTPRA